MTSPELKYLEKELADLSKEVAEIRATQASYVDEHHKLEKAIVEMRSDLSHIKASQDSLNGNLGKILFIIGGGFIAAFVSWIIKGGLGGA
jgi:chromosome segregation ATPase